LMPFFFKRKSFRLKEMMYLETAMLKINIECFAINFKKLENDNEGSWFSGKAGDWQWNIENFGMSWGIASTFDEAFANAKKEIQSIRKDFDVSDHDIYAMAKPEPSRWQLPTDYCEF